MNTTAVASRRDLRRWLIVLVTVLTAAVSLLLAHTYESQHSGVGSTVSATPATADPQAPATAQQDLMPPAEDGTPGVSLLDVGCILAVLVAAVAMAIGGPVLLRTFAAPGPRVFAFLRALAARPTDGPSLISLSVSRT
ncbi:hypothetical protein ACF1AJ_19845 [Leifsonia sp. NPDC014704]|uniref:hypothetical protein n=1 Tax=Leifsonia sp. NPDC014704 TaxID=3364123 RepID=UPI0036F488AD